MVKVKKFRKRLGKRKVLRRVKRTMKRYAKKRPMYKRRINRKYGSKMRKKVYKKKQRKMYRSGIKQFKKYKYGVIGNMKQRLSYKNITVTGCSTLNLVAPTFIYFLNSKKLAVATMEGLTNGLVHANQMQIYSENRAKLFRENLLGNGYEGLMENPILDMVKTTVVPHMTFEDNVVQFSMYDKFNNNPESTGALANHFAMSYADYMIHSDDVLAHLVVCVSFPVVTANASKNFILSMEEFVTDGAWWNALDQDEKDGLDNLNRVQLFTTYATQLVSNYYASVHHRSPSNIGQLGLHIMCHFVRSGSVQKAVVTHRAIQLGQLDFTNQVLLTTTCTNEMEQLYRDNGIAAAKRLENVRVVNTLVVAENNVHRDKLRILYSLNVDERMKFCLFLGQAYSTMRTKADEYRGLPAGAPRDARLVELPYMDYFNELLANTDAAVVDYNYLHQLIKDGYVRVKFLSKKKMTFKPKSGTNSHFYFVGRGNGIKLKTYYRRDLSTLAEVFAKINKNENLRQGLTEEGRKLLRKINPAFNYHLLGARID